MSSSSSDAPTNFQQPSLEYFRSTADDDAAIIEARREERREQQRRKKDDKKFRKMFGDWRGDQTYRLRHGTKIDAYKASGSYRDKLDEFQSFLDAIQDVPSSRNSSDDASGSQYSSYSRSVSPAVVANPMFAPPSFDEPSVSLSTTSIPSPPVDTPMVEPPAPEPTSSVPKTSASASTAPTTDDSFANRLLLAKQKALALAAAIPPPPPPPPPVTPPKSEEAVPPPPPTAAYNPTISAEPVRYNATISAAPVRYDVPVPKAKDADEEANARPTKKQKKEAPKSKAALMMAKMGYVKGQGLGKNSDGVTTHLEVKKRKDQGNRQAQDEFDGDGKRIKAQQVFDIMGGLRKEPKDHGPFGEPSRVIVTWGCVDNVDFSTDADRDDGGIRQELGDIFNTKASYMCPNTTFPLLMMWFSLVPSNASTLTCRAIVHQFTLRSKTHSVR
jgi:splicing factor 45